MFASAVVPLALAASALANVFITNPISTTDIPAGQEATLSWQDSGDAPSLADFGHATFAIYVGNALQQTPLQTIATNIDVSAMSSLTFKVDPTIGPDSGEYFIRVTSQSLKNPQSPQYYEEAFSAKFSLSGMSGSFNSSLQAEINGQSTAPIGGTSSASTPLTTAASTGTSAPLSTPLTSSSPKTSATGTTSAATPSTTSTNAAGRPVMATGLVALVATLVGASFL